MYDIRNKKILFEKEPYTVRPIASITKVASAIVSDELLKPDQNIIIDGNALAQDSDNGLMLYESWPFKKLLDFSLLVSSNDGAYAIAEIAGAFIKKDNMTQGTSTLPVDSFVQKMNSKMTQLGLRNTNFNNPSGLDVNSETSGGYSTAFEIAKLFEYAIENKYELLEVTTLQSDEIRSGSNILHDAVNTNNSFNSIPSLLASKTGYTELAGGNLAVVFDAGINHPIAVVVLHSTYEDRFSDVTELVQATNDFFAQ